MFYNFLTVTFARLFGYKLFLHHHASSYIKSYDLRFATLCRLAGERSLHIVLSEQMAKDLKLHYNSAQTVVAHNASHILACEKHERIDKNGMLTMGFLSNLTIEKGLDTVLDAFESIYSDGLDAQLLLAGPIVDERAHALIAAARLKFGDALIELGSVSGEAKDRFFSSIDLFLFPSRYRFEAQPLVILEALSHGVAVLATDHGYIQEIISPLGTGVGASDFISFTDRYVREWTRDETFRCSQRAAARCRFLELANEAKCQEISLYQLIAGDQSTSAG
ncbi:glycosyltransferase [Methylocystis echinoides]|uniref:glycosyltransferase family 4 protein n=1 Tax=Methylocystis echinoides TaxID=29468 RepID=UPI00342B5387